MFASIIIPAYNSEGTIGACIRSLRAQRTKRKYEIIVVDDGSTDNTAAAAKRLGARVLRQDNGGPAKARNLGVRNAKGSILLFTDSDCTPEPSWLDEMLRPFSDRAVTGVQGAYRTSQASLVARFVQLEIEERYERMERHAGSIDFIGSYSAAYRRSDFLEAGGFDESFPKASGEDTELSYKLAKKGKKLVFNRHAIMWHTHPETITKYFWTKFYRAYYRIPLYSKHMDKMLSDSYTTKSVKLQVIGGYFGALTTVLIPALYLIGHFWEAAFLLGLGTVLLIVTTLTSLKTFWQSAMRDFRLAVFSLFMIQVRTCAFMLGLPAGTLGKLVESLKKP